MTLLSFKHAHTHTCTPPSACADLIAGKHRALCRTLRGPPQYDGRLRSSCQIPARDSQPVCLAGWHFSRLYLQQPLEEKDLITTWNIYNSSISREAGRKEDNKKQTERMTEVYGSVLWFCLRAYTSNTHTHTQMWLKVCIHRFSHNICGSREQSGVSASIFLSGQIKCMKQQLKMMSLSHSCPYHSLLRSSTVCVRVCACICVGVHVFMCVKVPQRSNLSLSPSL